MPKSFLVKSRKNSDEDGEEKQESLGSAFTVVKPKATKGKAFRVF